MKRVIKATEGQTFQYPSCRGNKKIMKTITVKPNCNGTVGNWYCITHGLGFRDQLEKDFHVNTGNHVLCWICLEHGAEVP